MKLKLRSAWEITIVTVIAGIVAYFLVEPDTQIPTHWNAEGEVDGYSSPLVGFFLLPIIQLISLGFIYALRFIDPRAKNLESSGKAISAVATSVAALLLVVQLMIIDQVFSIGLIGPKAIFIGVGVMFAVIGNYLGKLKSSFFVGIRTPWTLSSEAVWQKTHRLGGKLFVAMGLLQVAGVLLLDQVYMTAFMLGTVLPTAFIPVAYSWYLWRKEQREG